MRVSRLESQKGNILFIILICVILFAALAYAVTSAMNGGGKSAKQEKEQLTLATNQQCESLVENSALRLKVMHGCTDAQISYELPNGANSNPDAPANKKCHVFAPQGAGATPCGAWLNTAIATGTITNGDTTTIALIGTSTYVTCPSWNASYCNMQFSTDGTNWKPGCFVDASASGVTRSSNVMTFVYAFVNDACQAACSDTAAYEDSGSASGDAYYIENDYSLSPLTGSCSRYVRRFNCNCW